MFNDYEQIFRLSNIRVWISLGLCYNRAKPSSMTDLCILCSSFLNFASLQPALLCQKWCFKMYNCWTLRCWCELQSRAMNGWEWTVGGCQRVSAGWGGRRAVWCGAPGLPGYQWSPVVTSVSLVTTALHTAHYKSILSSLCQSTDRMSAGCEQGT